MDCQSGGSSSRLFFDVVSAVVRRNLRRAGVARTWTSARCGHITKNVLDPFSMEAMTCATGQTQLFLFPTWVRSPSRSLRTCVMRASGISSLSLGAPQWRRGGVFHALRCPIEERESNSSTRRVII